MKPRIGGGGSSFAIAWYASRQRPKIVSSNGGGVDQIAGFYYSDHRCCTTFVANAIAKDERVVVPHPNFAAGGGIGFVNY